MTHLEPQNLWWETITGPASLLDEIVDACLEQKIALIKHAFPLPFYPQFQDTVHDRFQDVNREIQLLTLDLSAYEGQQEVDLFFLDAVADRDQVSKYRRSEKVVDFLEKHKIIYWKLLWIEGISQQYQKEWETFFRSFSSSLLADSYVVLPWKESYYVTEAQRFKILEYEKIVHYHDTRLYCHLLLHRSEGEKGSYYFSSVASHLAGNDGELAQFLLDIPDFFEVETVSLLEEHLENYLYGYEPEDFGASHFISNQNPEYIKKCLWYAQLEVLFPMIELTHRGILKEWEEDIAEYLERYPVEQFHVEIKHPNELELGTLFYIRKNIPAFDEALHEEIEFLRKCRNLIAHGDICRMEDVKRLLDSV